MNIVGASKRALHTANLTSLKKHIDTTSAAGRLFFTICAAFDKYEREIISERTSVPMLQYQHGCKSMSSRPPYGFRIQGDRLEIVQEQQEVIEKIHKLWMEGRRGYSIATRLQHLGIPSPSGKTKWVPSTVRAIVRRYQTQP